MFTVYYDLEPDTTYSLKAVLSSSLPSIPPSPPSFLGDLICVKRQKVVLKGQILVGAPTGQRSVTPSQGRVSQPLGQSEGERGHVRTEGVEGNVEGVE